jgi:hypothetical protein
VWLPAYVPGIRVHSKLGGTLEFFEGWLAQNPHDPDGPQRLLIVFLTGNDWVGRRVLPKDYLPRVRTIR